MRIVVDRKWPKADYTIGRLYIDGEYYCNTLEDTDRKLDKTMLLSQINKTKIKGRTAIPTGVYPVTLKMFSPSFGNREFYKKLCNGNVPRLLGVPGFDGILIHCGTNADHTEGCILVGRNTIKGKLTESKECFTAIYNKMKQALDKGEAIQIEVKRK